MNLDKRNNSFNSEKHHSPKFMEMNPEIQIYAKQWTYKFNERKMIEIFEITKKMNKITNKKRLK